MALQKTVTIRVVNKDVVFEDAYIKIVSVTGSKDDLNVIANVLTAFDGDIIKTFEFSFVPDQSETSLRWDKQAYEHLKTTDEFVDAVDV